MEPETVGLAEIPEILETLEVLEAVEEEMREQAAIDEYDEPAATKVIRRDTIRSALESELGIEPDDGVNPA